MSDMKNVRLSVVIPGFNTPKFWWERCVKSVRHACGPNDEIICVDDGSHVPVTGFWSEIAGGDERVKLLTLGKNSGQSIARNAAIDIAKGQYVTFVDSDDEVIVGCYDECFKAFTKYNSDIVVYGLRTVWSNDGFYREYALSENNYNTPKANNIKELKESFLFDYPVNKIYKRSFIEINSIRFESEICPGEDVAFNLLCLLSNARVSVIPFIGYIYYRMDGTTLSRYFPNIRKTLLYRSTLWQRYISRLPDLAVLGVGETFSEKDILYIEWKNMWRKGSDKSILYKLRFAMKNRTLFRHGFFFEVLWMMVYTFLRRYCYIRPIRRWHIKRVYPNIRKIKQ